MYNIKIELKKLQSGDNFSTDQSYALCEKLLLAPAAQQAACLALLAAKGETIAELQGALQYILEQAVIFPEILDVVDIVGTGGDGLKTFNISTAASLLVAACGVKVAKHGGRAITGTVGSADVIQYLGIKLAEQPQEILQQLHSDNHAYICAPNFNPFLKAIAPLRKQLAIPSIFNILAPLANPLKPQCRLIGVYSYELLHKTAQLLQAIGCKRAMVVHSFDGLDEISISAPTNVVELNNGCISEYIIRPEDVGLQTGALSEIIGGNAQENAQIIVDVLAGKICGARRDVVVFNAAAGLLMAERVDCLAAGVQMAERCIDVGRGSIN